jgi:outer membrane receptor protein involved in Fe transport
MTFRNALYATAAVALVSSFDAPVYAQEAEGGADDNEIVVTATKRAESILDIPIAVSVVGAEELDQKNASGFADYLTAIPGVQYNPGGNIFSNSIAMRGVSDGTASYLTQQTTALYLDDTALTLSQGAINLDYSVFGVEQINVIKGPNSTLYGAAALGGTIKVVTRAPSLDEVRGNGKFALSSTKSGDLGYSAAGTVSVPLSEGKAAVELTGYYNKRGGYIDEVVIGGQGRNRKNINGSETYGARLALRLQPTDELTIDFKGYYQKYKADGLDTFGPLLAGDLKATPKLLDELQADRFALGTLSVNYDLDFADLVSITSYYDRKASTVLDVSFTFLNFFPGTPNGSQTTAPAKVFSQELRLVSQGDSPFKWLLGGYYSHENYSEIGGLTAGPPGLFQTDSNYKYNTYAAFAELGYDLTDELNFTVGGRYTKYKTTVDLNSSIFFVPGVLKRSDRENDFSPRIALNYNYGTGSVYAQASRGFRLGQVNIPIPTLPGEVVPAFFTSDNLWNYEIGAKTRWLDDRLSANIAIYQIDWKDIQVTLTGGTGFTFIDNAGQARIRGVELEAVARPSDSLTWTGNIGYIDGRITQPVPGVALDNARLPGSPKWTFSTSLQQNFRLGSNDGYLRADLLHYGAYDDAFTLVGRPAKNGDYVKIDLRSGLTLGKVDLGLFVTNLTDARPILARVTFLPDSKTSLQPRTFGVSAGIKF